MPVRSITKGGNKMFRIFILLTLLFTGFDESYAIAQDQCEDILKHGIYELNERYSEDETDDFVTNWICNIKIN